MAEILGLGLSHYPGFIYPDHVESDLMNSCKCVAIFAPMEVPARA